MALSDSALKVLKPRDKPYIVTDREGLYVEVLTSGVVVWRYRYRLKGRQEKITLGKYPDLGLKAARLKRAELATMVMQGQSPAQEKQLARQALSTTTTVREFGEKYFQDVVIRDRKDPSTLRRYLDKEIYPRLGTRAMNDVTPGDIQTIVDMKKGHGFDAAAAAIRLCPCSRRR